MPFGPVNLPHWKRWLAGTVSTCTNDLRVVRTRGVGKQPTLEDSAGHDMIPCLAWHPRSGTEDNNSHIRVFEWSSRFPHLLEGLTSEATLAVGATATATSPVPAAAARAGRSRHCRRPYTRSHYSTIGNSVQNAVSSMLCTRFVFAL